MKIAENERYLHKKLIMKKTILSAVLALTTAFGVNAQLTEGHISYQIDMVADNPEMAMAVGMMQGSTLNTYINKEMTRTEMTMGTMMTTTTVMDVTAQKGIMLLSGMMGKKAIKLDLKTMNEDAKKDVPKYTITKTTETKEILGYTCTKTVLTTEDGIELNYWLTDKIKANFEGQQMYFDGIDGFPLQFEIYNQGLRMTLTTTKLETSLTKEQKSTLFGTDIPSGYAEMSMEDLKKMGM